MSGTSLAMGRQIEQYMRTGVGLVSVGEVAKANECTKQTARKYLEMLRKSGTLKAVRQVGQGGLRMMYELNITWDIFPEMGL